VPLEREAHSDVCSSLLRTVIYFLLPSFLCFFYFNYYLFTCIVWTTQHSLLVLQKWGYWISPPVTDMSGATMG
jgi:hypothetical protein